MKRFDNRTVIVTGGAGGMGASHSRGFVAESANVVIADILEQQGRTLADELGDSIHPGPVRTPMTAGPDAAAAARWALSASASTSAAFRMPVAPLRRPRRERSEHARRHHREAKRGAA